MRTLSMALLIAAVIAAAHIVSPPPARASDTDEIRFEIIDNGQPGAALVFDRKDIVIEVQIHPYYEDEYVVVLILPDKFASAFERLTASNVGRNMRTYINGRIVAEPTIQEPIPGGEIQINALFTKQEAEALADRMR